MTAAISNQWSASFAQPAAFGNTPPALQSTVIALNSSTNVGSGSGTPTAGNWLVCIAGWNQAGLTPATIGYADDLHSFWRPGDVTKSDWAVSESAASTRTSIWYSPNLIRQAGDVYCAPSGAVAGMACTVLEISGLGPWDTVTGIYSNYAAAATSLNLALAAPSASSAMIAAVCGDSSAAGQAFAPSGWTTLVTTTASNGTDHTCDAVLTAAVLPSTTGSVSVSGTATTATDLSGVIIAFQINAPSPIPAGANPAWPGRVILEAALGSGMETPPDQCTWTTLSDNAWTSMAQGWKRFWGWKDKSGIPWGLGQYQSASGSVQLDNFDGAVSPSNVGSPFYSTALNRNMSFQSGVSPWTGQNGAVIAQSSAQSFASAGQGLPMYSMQLNGNGSTSTPYAVSDEVPVTGSAYYSASFWCYSASSWASGITVNINWYTSGNSYISTTGNVTVSPLAAGTWTQAATTGVQAPSNAAYASINATIAGTPGSSQAFYIAEAALVAGSAVVRTGLVTAGTPVRVRMALGTITTREGSVTYNRWYVWQRNTRAWPEKRNKALRGFVNATTSDAWAAATGTCPTPYRGEAEQDAPYAWWPCDDQPLTGGVLPTSLRNAAKGNSNTLAVQAASAGVAIGDAYSTTGTDLTTDGTVAAGLPPGNPAPSVAVYQVAQQQGWLYGDPQSSPQSAQSGNPVTAQPGSAAWQQTALQGDTGSNSWFLACNDANFPALSGGVSFGFWFNAAFFGTAKGFTDTAAAKYDVAGQPYAPITLATLATASAPVAVLQLAQSGGALNLITYNGSTGTSHSIYSASDLRSNSWHHVMLTTNGSSWTVYVDGGLTASVSGTGAGMTSAWTWLAVNADFGAGGGSSLTSNVHGGNVAYSGIMVFPSVLPAWRVRAHYTAGITGFGLIPAPQSVQVSTVLNRFAGSSYTPDGSEFGGSYGISGATVVSYGFSALAVSKAGSYTSGPAARTTVCALGGNTGGNLYGAAVWVGWTAVAPQVQVYT